MYQKGRYLYLMYIKKKDRILFEELDHNLKLPTCWDKFLKKRIIKNNLIIKSKDLCYCTNCKNTFNNRVKVNDYCKCPYCKHTYLVKSSRLKSYRFNDNLAILQEYKSYYILRIFRLEMISKNKSFCFNYYCYEYGRVIYDIDFNILYEIINENMIGTTGGIFPSYRKEVSTNWRYSSSYYSYLPKNFIYYPNNLKKVLMNIKELKYSQLWILANKIDYFDLIYLIKHYNDSVEFLIKMKLYNLALCPETFKNKKNFNERFFGLTKDYISFIRKYNLNLDELITLSFIKTKNINLLKKFDSVSEDILKNLKSKNINFSKLIKFTDFSYKNCHEYMDYLNMLKILGINLKDRKNLYPKNIKQIHDKVLKEYEIKKNEKMNRAINRRSKELQKYSFKDKNYIIFPAESYDSLIDESKQQNNCVRTYYEKYAKKECDIYFMRLLKDKEHSLVTIEVKNNMIVQKRTKNNGITTKKQDNFLNKWQKVILERSK